jgi:hypothetical protein
MGSIEAEQFLEASSEDFINKRSWLLDGVAQGNAFTKESFLKTTRKGWGFNKWLGLRIQI